MVGGAVVSAFLAVGDGLGGGDGDCDNARFVGDQSELLLLGHRRHASIEALEHRAEQSASTSPRSNSHLRPRLLLLSSFVLSPHVRLKTPPPFGNTSTAMKLSDIDLELDAVDLVRLSFLAATAGVSMHSHPRSRLSPG
jgi:hypothetical protein